MHFTVEAQNVKNKKWVKQYFPVGGYPDVATLKSKQVKLGPVKYMEECRTQTSPAKFQSQTNSCGCIRAPI